LKAKWFIGRMRFTLQAFRVAELFCGHERFVHWKSSGLLILNTKVAIRVGFKKKTLVV